MPRLSPTMKQRKFVKRYIETGSPKQAALDAYNTTPKTASVLGNNILQSPTVRKYLYDCLENQGLTDKKIARKLDDIMEAGTTKEALSKSTPALAFKILQEANKIKDNYPVERRQIETRNAHINIDVKGKTEMQLTEMLEKLSTELSTFKKLVTDTKAREAEIV